MSRARDVADGALGTIAGTNGQVLTSNGTVWSSQAVPTELPAVGASGNVLTSTGSAWASQAAAGGAGLNFISKITLNNSADATFTNQFSADYKRYVVIGTQIQQSANSRIRYDRKTTGSSSSFAISTPYAEAEQKQASEGYSWTNNATTFNITNFSGGTLPINATAFNFWIDGPMQTNQGKVFWSEAPWAYRNSTTNTVRMLRNVGFDYDTTAITDIRFFPQSGNFVSGTISLYGIAEA